MGENIILKKMKELLKKSKTAIIAVHKDPDGDALGSMIAVGLVLKRLGLKTTLYSIDGVPKIYKFLPEAKKIVKKIPKQKKFDLLVTVDSSSLKRIGKYTFKYKKIINIDHHPDNTNFGDVNCVQMLSSVAEQIFHICKYLNIKIDKKIAIALYVAIITDTGNFRYSNTLPSTFEVAQKLVEAGANPWKISTLVYDTYTVTALKILAKTIDTITLSNKGKIAWGYITEKMNKQVGSSYEDTVGIIDFIRSIKGPDLYILFREVGKNNVKVNFRSKGKLNVQKLAKIFKGGGHKQASGVTIHSSLKKTIKSVLKKAATFIPHQ